jgi:hypothetical protein
MKSDTWCLGGTTGSCWGPEKHTVSASTPPTSFKEFDDVLERVCPNITFLQYKRIYNHSVLSDTEHHSDYYGGSVEYGFYVCDLPKLYEMLVEMKLIKKEGQNGLGIY